MSHKSYSFQTGWFPQAFNYYMLCIFYLSHIYLHLPGHAIFLKSVGNKDRNKIYMSSTVFTSTLTSNRMFTEPWSDYFLLNCSTIQQLLITVPLTKSSIVVFSFSLSFSFFLYKMCIMKHLVLPFHVHTFS